MLCLSLLDQTGRKVRLKLLVDEETLSLNGIMKLRYSSIQQAYLIRQYNET